MNPNRYSIAWLLLVLTLAALFLWVMKLAIVERGVWSTAVAASILFVVINLGIFATLYAILYPLGRIDQLMSDKLKVPQSPFAGDRLPKQIIPTRNNEQAH